MNDRPGWGSRFRGAKGNGRRGKGFPTGCFSPVGGGQDGTIGTHSLNIIISYRKVPNETTSFLGTCEDTGFVCRFGQALPERRIRRGVGKCKFRYLWRIKLLYGYRTTAPAKESRVAAPFLGIDFPGGVT